jgi:enterochelin esterase-like enzyme
MKTFRQIFLLSFLLLATSSVQAGRIVTDSVQSKILGTGRTFNVYLPDGYEQNTNQKYPVLYLLHGLTDDYRAWRDRGGLQIVADELIGTGEMRPMLIIMPNAGGDVFNGVWNGYFNMPGWAYEDFFFKEFIPAVEQKYRIQGDKGHRAVSGLSMGGGGSVVYCQRHPDMFSSCYAFSAWLDADNVTDEMRKDQKKISLVTVSVRDHSAVDFLKNADDATKEKLRTVKWFLDVGDDDFLLEVNEKFHMLMRNNHIPCEFRVRNGNHNWEYWHTGLRTSLPFVSRNFDK